MADLHKIQFNNRTILTPSRDSFVAYYTEPEPSHDPVVDTFYMLTYFDKANKYDSSATASQIRAYNLGNAYNFTPDSDISKYTSSIEDKGFGSMLYVGNTSRVEGNHKTGWMKYQMTSEQVSAYMNGTPIQYEFLFYINGTNSTYCGGAAGSTDGPVNSWYNQCFPHLDSGSMECMSNYSGISSPTSSMTSLDTGIVTTFSSGSWRSLKVKYSWLANNCRHLCYTHFYKENKLLLWANGKLVAKIYYSNNYKNAFTTRLNNGLLPTFVINPAAFTTSMRIAQFGIRPAVWTAEQNYTSPSKPYLSTEEYY